MYEIEKNLNQPNQPNSLNKKQLDKCSHTPYYKQPTQPRQAAAEMVGPDSEQVMTLTYLIILQKN